MHHNNMRGHVRASCDHGNSRDRFNSHGRVRSSHAHGNSSRDRSNFPDRGEKNMNGCKLFLGNLPTDFTQADIERLFKHFGKILNFTKKEVADPNCKKTYGFVVLESASSAYDAVREIKGNEPPYIHVDFANERDVSTKAFNDNTKSKASEHRYTSSHFNEPSILNDKKQGVCKCCGKIVYMYCFRCSLWQCCRHCENADQNLQFNDLTNNDRETQDDHSLENLQETQNNSKDVAETSEAQSLKDKVILETETLEFFKYISVVVAESCGSYKYYVILKSNYPDVCQLCAVLKVAEDTNPLKPYKGSLCIAMYENVWYRAQIIEVSPSIKVKYVDFGNVGIVSGKDIKTLPAEAMAMKAQAIEIELYPGTPKKYEKLPAETELTIACVDKVNNTYVALVDGVSYDMNAEGAENDSPTSQESENTETKVDLKYVPLRDGSCILTHFSSLKEVYIQALSKNVTEYGAEIFSIISSYCKNASPITKIPNKGEILAAKFAVDKNFYRAMVTDVLDTGEIMVNFVDFGNKEIVSLSDLTNLPDNIVHLPWLAVPASLRNVSDVNCPEVNLLIRKYIKNEDPFFVKLISSNPYEVDLFLPNGDLLNDQINKMLPELKQQSDFCSINDVPIPSFQIGKPIHLYLHSVLYNVDEICVSPLDAYFTLKKLNEEIVSFCERAKPYTPLEHEVCFGQLQDRWLRCLILQIKQNEAEVKVIDSGESAIMYNFRKINEKFLKLEAGGFRCKLAGITGNATVAERDVLQTFLQPRSIIQTVIQNQNKYSLTVEVVGLDTHLHKYAK